MNKVMLHGRISYGPEAQIYGENKKVTFSVAVQRRGKNAPADFFNCQCWDKTADFVELYFKKGKEIVLEGELRNDTYTNKDGKKVTTTYIYIERYPDFCGPKEDAAPKQQEAPAPKPAPKEDNPYMDETPDFKQLDLDSLDGELPFI